ncbi:Membrane protein involved in the export of O-antigen and teichoic acid [Thalassovita litoralis]|uniref:Membrane protein involved in the export of O-antigen and teichoic acid n=1 Tax=Thalassovita litoralis TaxID=1010611 RepID=A0A521D326_9RHOB|nr:oligosaccharide flippase family protein [Thalassovita litoralis]SMO66093.1 Membrane protein involved in the export of O-antigen and teichoic acid [Thalassovita litoralis]
MLRVATVLAGLSIASQVAALMALPIITALFSPEDFNNFAAFSSAALILITLASLRLEMAIPIVSSDRDAGHLAMMGSLICLTLAVVVWIALQFVLPLGGEEDELDQILEFLPLAVLFGGAQAILLSIALRGKRLQATGVVRIIQTLAGIAVQITLGLWSFQKFGLTIGFLANLAVGALLLLVIVRLGRSQEPMSFNFAELKRVARENSQYLRYSSLDALLNTSGLQVPLFLIATYGEGAAGGFLFLAIKLFYTPSTIISGAFAKIFHSAVGSALRENTVAQLTEETLFHLMRYGGAFVIAVVVLGPTAIALLMSDEWAHTSTILVWMSPWIMIQLLVSPIGTIMMATGRQKELFRLSVAGFILRAGGVVLTLLVNKEYGPIALSMTSMVFYVMALRAFSKQAGVELKAMGLLCRRSVPIWSLVVIVSAAMRFLVDAYV